MLKTTRLRNSTDALIGKINAGKCKTESERILVGQLLHTRKSADVHLVYDKEREQFAIQKTTKLGEYLFLMKNEEEMLRYLELERSLRGSVPRIIVQRDKKPYMKVIDGVGILGEERSTGEMVRIIRETSKL